MAASLSSAAERGPASQESSCPHSTTARIWLARRLSGAALTTLADSTLSPSSFHHSGLATSAHASQYACMMKVRAAALAHQCERSGKHAMASPNRFTASTWCPEWMSTAPRLKYAKGSSGLSAMASRKARAALSQSSRDACRAPSAISSSYASGSCVMRRLGPGARAAMRSTRSSAWRVASKLADLDNTDQPSSKSFFATDGKLCRI